jgi:hypothetical protein
MVPWLICLGYLAAPYHGEPQSSVGFLFNLAWVCIDAVTVTVTATGQDSTGQTGQTGQLVGSRDGGERNKMRWETYVQTRRMKNTLGRYLVVI